MNLQHIKSFKFFEDVFAHSWQTVVIEVPEIDVKL